MTRETPWTIHENKIDLLSTKFKKNPDTSVEAYKNVNDRYVLFQQLNKMLKSIGNKQCIIEGETGKLSIDNKLFIYKRIGTKSKYGHAYMVMTENLAIKAAAKIVDTDFSMDENRYTARKIHMLKKLQKATLREIEVLNKIQKEFKNNLHLPVIYKIMFCDLDADDNVWVHDVPVKSSISTSSPLNLDPTNYYIVLNELAHGDLKSFISKKKYDTEAIYVNTFVQVYLSILSLHNLGYVHNDSHYGNFLYHLVEPGGCIHYKIDDVDLYIENLGFIWVIWDFGLCKTVNYSYMDDYTRIIDAFIPRRLSYSTFPWRFKKGWNNISKGYKQIFDIDRNLSKNIVTSRDLFKHMIEIGTFSNEPIGKIINKKPIKLSTFKSIFF